MTPVIDPQFKAMASEPTVCAIMLTKDRPELAARAVRCFRAQTYDPIRRYLIIFDTGDPSWYDPRSDSENEAHYKVGSIHSNEPIGKLRNRCADMVDSGRDSVICHWDSDDYSHPNRIAEQVAFLQSSGAAVVGYNQMLFWRDTDPAGPDWRQKIARGEIIDVTSHTGESWLYTGPPHQPLGTSLCYWRKTWESHRFDDRKHAGEDTDFLARVGHRRVKSESSIPPKRIQPIADDYEPRMIATVHGANTQQKTYDGFFKGGTVEMKRCAEWDERLRITLEGA